MVQTLLGTCWQDWTETERHELYGLQIRKKGFCGVSQLPDKTLLRQKEICYLCKLREI